MKVIVIYPHDATFTVFVPLEDDGSLDRLRQILSYAWDSANPDSGSLQLTVLNNDKARLRSSMVGDIYIVDGRYFYVDGIGWREVSETQAVQIQRIPTEDRLMGWDWMRERHTQINKELQTIS